MTQNEGDKIVELAAKKTLEYLEKGVPAVGADGQPIFDSDGEPVRKAPGAADLRAYLAVANECDRRAAATGNTLGGQIKNALAGVKARSFKLTGTDE